MAGVGGEAAGERLTGGVGEGPAEGGDGRRGAAGGEWGWRGLAEAGMAGAYWMYRCASVWVHKCTGCACVCSSLYL